MYILPPSISKKIEGYRWQSFTPPAAGKSRRFRGLICHRRSQLNVVYDEGVRPYASEYLTHGMLCFIQGQYAVRVRNGGMLGYVLDGNVAQAIRNVSSLIEKRHEELRMQPPGEMMQSSILPEDRRLRETRHSRSFKPENFMIHHIFARGRY